MPNISTIQAFTTSIIAIVVILGTFGLVGFEVINGRPVELPTDVSLLIGAVTGAYLTHSAAANGGRAAGVAAAQATAAAIQTTQQAQGTETVSPKAPQV